MWAGHKIGTQGRPAFLAATHTYSPIKPVGYLQMPILFAVDALRPCNQQFLSKAGSPMGSLVVRRQLIEC